MKVIGRVTIGDCEGYNQKFSHYIELQDDQYTIDYDNIATLTKKGLKDFSTDRTNGWDVNYYNYVIRILKKDSEEYRNEYNRLQEQYNNLGKRLEFLQKFAKEN